MPDASALQAAQQALASGGDPILEGVKWLGVLVVGMMVAAMPVMAYIRKWNVDRAANSKDAASAELYAQLQQQITENANALRVMAAEKNAYFEKCTQLQLKVERNEEYKATIESMKERLDDKDRLLAERDTENRRLMQQVLELTERVHQLELRLAGIGANV